MSVLHRLWSYLGRKTPSDNPRMLIQGKPAPFSLDPELVEHIKSLTPSSDWTKIELPGKPKMLMDRDMIEYIQSPKPQPSQGSLDKMLKSAHAFRVIEGGVSHDNPLGNKILYETSDEKVLADLRHFLRIVDGPAGHCMCHGDTAVELLDGSGKRLATIGVHHGMSIRWSAWKDDAALVDGYSLLKFLAVVGVQYPLQIYLGSQNQRAAENADWKRWLAAMPPCLQPLLVKQGDLFAGYVAYQPSPGSPRPTHSPQDMTTPAHGLTRERWIQVRQALQDAYPDSMQRVQVLFQWFGQGGGLWSGFAVYEQVPEMLLMKMPIEDLLRALQGPSLPQALLEGAARFLAGWTFATRRGAELDLLPADLRQQLLNHSLQTEDPDKRARARAAFQRNTTLT